MEPELDVTAGDVQCPPPKGDLRDHERTGPITPARSFVAVVVLRLTDRRGGRRRCCGAASLTLSAATDPKRVSARGGGRSTMAIPSEVAAAVSLSSALVPVPTGALEVPIAAEPSDRRVRLSLVVPTYNESKNVRELVQRLTDLLEPALDGEYELLIVDDDSPDRTWEIARSLTVDYPRVRVMRRVGERGLSSAVIRGWQVARGDVLAVIDSDLQHPPEVTVQLWSEIERGADLAVASRHTDGGGVSSWSMIRRLLSRGAQLLGLVLLPGVLGRVSDPMSGYFMVRREAIGGRPMSPLGYKILIEVIGRGEIRGIGEVGYVFREREEGESKVTWRLYVDYLRHLVRLRRDRP